MTAAVLKPRKTDSKPRPIDVESLLKAKFLELMEDEQLDKLDKDDQEAILRVLRVANKIGYTNGYKKGSMDAKKSA